MGPSRTLAGMGLLASAIASAAAATLGAQPRAAQGTPATAGIPVQMGIAIRPETLTVGDPFTMTVRVRAPQGAAITFPAKPDSLAKAELLDPVRLSASADSAEQTATYRMAAWDVGEIPLVFEPVVVRLGGEERAVELGSTARVFVQSVLPADSAQRVPKPPRPPFDIARSLWWLWALLALAALLVGWLVWRWLRRRREGPGEIIVDPFSFAEREFERVEQLGLVDAGERGRYVALVVEVLRDYLARRATGAPSSLTSTELLHALRTDGRVPIARLAPVLAEADLVKFARRPVSAERARAIGAEARALVRDVHQSYAAADAAAAERAARVARRDAA
jgi:hypothetical protein